jgi:hypothetical protein
MSKDEPIKRDPAKDDIAKLLDAELAHATSEHNRHGISWWVLQISFGGLCWTLLTVPQYSALKTLSSSCSL